MTVKLDLGSIMSGKQEYLQDSLKLKNAGSRKRQNNPEKQFNEILEDISDKCIIFDSTKMFIQPVKKREAPDYHYKILRPMDLGTVKNKAKRWGILLL